jgi:hypothetical protein
MNPSSPNVSPFKDGGDLDGNARSTSEVQEPDSKNEDSVSIEEIQYEIWNRDQNTKEFKDPGLGAWDVIPTEGTDLQCGLFALIHSLARQAYWLPTPTLEDLQFIASTGVAQEIIQELGAFATEEEFDQNYLVDQLDSILQEYGRKYGENLRLGIYENGSWHPVFAGSAPQGVVTIYIHHDGGGIVGHYSGLG